MQRKFSKQDVLFTSLHLVLYVSFKKYIHVHSGDTLNGAHAVARFLCRLVTPDKMPLYGTTNLEKAEIDHWMEYSLTQLTPGPGQEKVLTQLNNILEPRVYLVGYDLSLADLAVYSGLRGKRSDCELFMQPHLHC